MARVWRWFKHRFKELDLLEKYFPLLFTRWQAAIWGGSVLAVAFGWHFITSDWPYPVKLSACIVALFFAGYYVWRADHIRLIPALSICRLVRDDWVVEGSAPERRATLWYFSVQNMSEGMTVTGVNVELNEIRPAVANLDWLPVHLHIKHDNPIRSQDAIRSFDLNPLGMRLVDFVSGFARDDYFDINHILDGYINHAVRSGTYRIQVKVTANNLAPVFKWFNVWTDDNGVLQCNMEENPQAG